eukprot:jgi/Bigna1/70549/fgenesh1_pg.12_\
MKGSLDVQLIHILLASPQQDASRIRLGKERPAFSRVLRASLREGASEKDSGNGPGKGEPNGNGDSKRRRDRDRDRDRDRERDRGRDRDRDRDRSLSRSDSSDDGDRRRKRDRKRRKKSSRRRRKRSRRKYSSSDSESEEDPKPRRKRGGMWDQGPAPGTTGFGVAPTIPTLGLPSVPGVHPMMLTVASEKRVEGGVGLGVGGRKCSHRIQRKPLAWSKFAAFDVLPAYLLLLTLQATNQHAARQARRVYLGNVTHVIVEAELVNFLNERIKAVPERTPLNPALEPVVSVTMNREKAYAFVEFHSEQDADIAVCMDGILFKGVIPLKIRRPKDYQPPQDGKQRVYHVPGIVSTNVEDGPNKVFIGNLPQKLGDAEVKEFLSTYGALKSFHLVKDSSTGLAKGYAFFEYADEKITDEACKGLNGIELAGKNLVCQRANIGAKPNANVSASLMGAVTNPALLGLPQLNSLPGLNKGGAVAYDIECCVMLRAARTGDSRTAAVDTGQNVGPSRILVLQNIIKEADLADNSEYEDVKADIKEECERMGGPVKEVLIPRKEPQMQESAVAVQGLGKVFIEFETQEGANKARLSLGGRKFNGRVVLSRFLSEEHYKKGLLDA